MESAAKSTEITDLHYPSPGNEQNDSVKSQANKLAATNDHSRSSKVDTEFGKLSYDKSNGLEKKPAEWNAKDDVSDLPDEEDDPKEEPDEQSF